MGSGDFDQLLEDTFARLDKTDITTPASTDVIPNDKDIQLSNSIDNEAIEAIMNVLISKEILKEPLQHLKNSLLSWSSKIAPDNFEVGKLTSIKKQCEIIDEIVLIFDSAEELNESDKKVIFEKMQDIQELGSPPKEVMDDISVHILK